MDQDLLLARIAYLEKENAILKSKITSLERLYSNVTKMYSDIKNKVKALG